jgi:chaperone required for assembly of F1-ATPase
MTAWNVRRFWTAATVRQSSDGYGVRLDERAVYTPGRAELLVPSGALAQAIAEEWDAQVDKIDPAAMPLTRAANAAIDKVSAQHAEVADMLAAYGDSDLLCYRADSPAELVSRQSAAWDPYLDWAETTLNARLQPRRGVVHLPQDSAALAMLCTQVHAMGNFELAAFHDLVSLTGSLILAFATIHRMQAVESIWAASRIDESWQIEQWGRDDQAEVLEKQKFQSFVNAEQFFRLIK